MRKLTSLNREELDSLAASKGVAVEEGDTAATLIEKLEQRGVTEAPSAADAEEPQEPQADAEERPLPRSTPAETPDYDPALRSQLYGLPAVAVNPAASYDDDAAGKPEDAPDAQPQMKE